MLKLRDICAGYGKSEVLRGVSLDVRKGEVVTLVGANGAGKTTTLKALCGLIPATGGTIEFEGARLSGRAPHEIVELGVTMVPEGRQLFAFLTVRENLLMGAYARSDRKAVAEDLERMLELFPRVAERIEFQAGTLSGGEQQMVAMARALMGRPQLICMDEPTMGLSPLYVDKVLELIARINSQGVSVFMVEQNASLALQIAHHGYVLQTGRIVLSGPARALLADARIRDAYLGGEGAARTAS